MDSIRIFGEPIICNMKEGWLKRGESFGKSTNWIEAVHAYVHE